MGHGKLVPAAIAPQTVHRIHHFDRGDVFIQQQVAVIRSTYLPLFVIRTAFVVEINHFPFLKCESTLQFIF